MPSILRISIGLFSILNLPSGLSAVQEEPVREPDLPVAAEVQPADTRLFGVESVAVVESEAVTPVVVTNGVADPDRPWHTVVRATGRVTFDDNIFIGSRDEVADVYISAIPEITVGWGDFRREFTSMTGAPSRYRTLPDGPDARNYFFATYAPEAVVFLENGDENTLNHDLSVRGAYGTGRWQLNALGRFQKLSDPDIEVGTRTDRLLFTLGGSARYFVSDKTSLEADYSLRRQDYESGVDSTDMLARLFVNYGVGAKTTVSVGAGLGYLAFDVAGDQIYEQALTRVRYAWSDKLSFALTSGVEFRQSVSEDYSTVNPVVEGAALWEVTDRTSLAFAALRRQDSSSVIAGETVEYSRVELRLRQILFQRFYLTMQGSYSWLDFDEESVAGGIDRSDERLALGLGVAVELDRHLSAQIAYRFERNDSTVEERSFGRNVAEFQLGYRF